MVPHVCGRARISLGAMSWLNNTTYVFHGLQHFTAAGYDRCSETFDNRYVLSWLLL